MYGIVRKMDELGRIVIQKEWANNLGLVKGSETEISKFGRYIILRRNDDKTTEHVSADSPLLLDLIQNLKELDEKDLLFMFLFVRHLVGKKSEN